MSHFYNNLNIAKESDKPPVTVDSPEVNKIAGSDDVPEMLQNPVSDLDKAFVEIDEVSDDLVEAQSTSKLIDASIKLIGVTDEKSPMFDMAVTAAEALQRISRSAQTKYGVAVRNSGVESFDSKKLSGFALKAVAREAEQTSNGIVAKVKAGIRKLIELIKGLFSRVTDALSSVKSKLASRKKEATGSTEFTVDEGVTESTAQDMEDAVKGIKEMTDAMNGEADKGQTESIHEKMRETLSSIEDTVKAGKGPKTISAKEYSALVADAENSIRQAEALKAHMAALAKQLESLNADEADAQEKLRASQTFTGYVKRMVDAVIARAKKVAGAKASS